MTDAPVTSLAEAHAAADHAVALARAGEHGPAAAAARALAAAHPDDATLLHKAGVTLALGGAHEDALRLFLAALDRLPGFHFTQMEVANTFLALQRPEDAAVWYLAAGRSAPTYALAFRRAADVLRELGRHGEALAAMQQARACDPGDPEVAASVANLLIFHNRRDAAAEAFGPVLAAGRMRPIDHSRYLKLLTELGRYEEVVAHASQFAGDARSPHGYDAAVLSGHAALAAALDRPSLVAAAQARQQSPRWLDPAGVVAALRAAIAAKQPLSLVRTGDGEARFLAHGDPRLRGLLTEAQVEALGDVPFRNWFGQPVAAADPTDLLRLQAASIAAIEQADILGVTAASRLAEDNLHIGYLGHLEALVCNVVRTETAMRLTDAMLHLDLHRLTPFYAEVLAGLDFVGVISPHPGLAARLAARHGIAAFAEYLLPGESRLPKDLLNRSAIPHFPDLFRTLHATLAVPKPGAVFIVAGGLLGKIYCHWIRARGGIAIDAGSIVDAWMGLNTRPGVYDRPQDWAL